MIYQQFLLRCDVDACGVETTLTAAWSYVANDQLWRPHILNALDPPSNQEYARPDPTMPPKGWRQLHDRVYCPKHDIQLTITTHVPNVTLTIDRILSEGQNQ